MSFLLGVIRDLLWSLPTVGLLTGTGIYFTVKSRFYPIRCIKKVINSVKTTDASGDISPIKGLMTALGGTVGVGSITGVAYAIAEGGAGALFWMWVSSFLCMMLKYAENYITVCKKGKNGGSAANILEAEGKRKTAFFFAVMGILSSFGSGNLAQASAFSLSANEIGMSHAAAGIIFAVCLLPAVFGGQKVIAKTNAFLVPAAGVIFLAAVTGITVCNITRIPDVMREIFTSAFGIKEFGAGISGTVISQALRTGVSKGVFSHEAGMGSSSMAHAAADTTPERAANFGIIEIFADTFAVSTLTALALLCSGSQSAEEMFFVSFGSLGGIILTMSVGVLAYSAVISWCFYSETLLKYIFGAKKAPFVLYRICAVLTAFLGCIWSAEAAWQTADIFNALMLFPNLYAVIIKRKEIMF